MLAAYQTRRASPLGYVVLGGYAGPDAWGLGGGCDSGCGLGCADCSSCPYKDSCSRGLGAISAEAAAEAGMPKSTISSRAGFRQQDYDRIVAAARSGSFEGWTGVDCQGGTGAGAVQLAQTASGLALTATTIGLTAAHTVAAAALAPWTMGISALIGLFPIIFGHHAAQVKKGNALMCAAIPAAKNYLAVIEQGVQSGAATPQQGIAALDSLLSDFKSNLASMVKMSASQCNAECIWIKQLTAIVAYQKSVYQDMSAAQGAAATSSGPLAAATVTSGSTLQIPSSSSSAALPAAGPNWLGIAALVALGFVFSRMV